MLAFFCECLTDTSSGLGDRFMRFALLATLALDLKLTPVYEPSGLLANSTCGEHGSYAWAQEFFNWGEGMLRLDDIKDNSKLQHISFEVRLGHKALGIVSVHRLALSTSRSCSSSA
jgi:hypothetical protein